MIHLTRGNIDTIIITADTTLTNNFYYVKFTNRTTQDVVETWYENQSGKDRFQKFDISTDDFFANFNEGFWTYTIQMATGEGIVPTSAILESGFMYLHPATDFEMIKYNEQSNTFKAYNG